MVGWSWRGRAGGSLEIEQWLGARRDCGRTPAAGAPRVALRAPAAELADEVFIAHAVVVELVCLPGHGALRGQQAAGAVEAARRAAPLEPVHGVITRVLDAACAEAAGQRAGAGAREARVKDESAQRRARGEDLRELTFSSRRPQAQRQKYHRQTPRPATHLVACSRPSSPHPWLRRSKPTRRAAQFHTEVFLFFVGGVLSSTTLLSLKKDGTLGFEGWCVVTEVS